MFTVRRLAYIHRQLCKMIEFLLVSYVKGHRPVLATACSRNELGGIDRQKGSISDQKHQHGNSFAERCPYDVVEVCNSSDNRIRISIGQGDFLRSVHPQTQAQLEPHHQTQGTPKIWQRATHSIQQLCELQKATRQAGGSCPLQPECGAAHLASHPRSAPWELAACYNEMWL